MSYSDLTKGRVSLINRAYLITSVCHQRQPIFVDITCARIVIKQMKLLQKMHAIKSFAYVLMPDHLHWLFCLERQELSSVVHQLKGSTAREINAIKKTMGAVWQRGFHDHAIRQEEEIKSIARYIIANPIRAGLVKSVADYPHWDAIWLNNTLDR